MAAVTWKTRRELFSFAWFLFWNHRLTSSLKHIFKLEDNVSLGVGQNSLGRKTTGSASAKKLVKSDRYFWSSGSFMWCSSDVPKFSSVFKASVLLNKNWFSFFSLWWLIILNRKMLVIPFRWYFQSLCLCLWKGKKWEIDS